MLGNFDCVDIMTETGGESRRKIGENRSVMPFDVLGHTRATLTGAASFDARAAARANLRGPVVLRIGACNCSP